MADEIVEEKPPLDPPPLDPAVVAAVLGEETPAERAAIEEAPQARLGNPGVSRSRCCGGSPRASCRGSLICGLLSFELQ